MPGLGREVLNILGKRKVDLTSDDIETMRRVIGVAEDAEAHASANVRDDERRRALMAVGHDPSDPPERRADLHARRGADRGVRVYGCTAMAGAIGTSARTAYAPRRSAVDHGNCLR
nr:hypothetical protein GCM10020093_064620 [Planobispora longispora]